MSENIKAGLVLNIASFVMLIDAMIALILWGANPWAIVLVSVLLVVNALVGGLIYCKYRDAIKTYREATRKHEEAALRSYGEALRSYRG